MYKVEWYISALIWPKMVQFVRKLNPQKLVTKNRGSKLAWSNIRGYLDDVYLCMDDPNTPTLTMT